MILSMSKYCFSNVCIYKISSSVCEYTVMIASIFDLELYQARCIRSRLRMLNHFFEKCQYMSIYIRNIGFVNMHQRYKCSTNVEFLLAKAEGPERELLFERSFSISLSSSSKFLASLLSNTFLTFI